MTWDPRIREALARPPRPDQVLTRAAIAVSFARWHRESRLLLGHLKSLPIDERVLWLSDPDLKPSVEAMVPEHVTEFNRSIPADAAKSAMKRGIKKGRRDSEVQAAANMVKAVASGVALPFKAACTALKFAYRSIGPAARAVGSAFPTISVSGVRQLLGNGAGSFVATTWWVSALGIEAAFAGGGRWLGGASGNPTLREMLASLSPPLTLVLLIAFRGRPRWGRMLAATIVGVTAAVDLWERGAREFARLTELWRLIPDYGPIPLWPKYQVYVAPLLQSLDGTAAVCMIIALGTLILIPEYIGKEDD